jgi:hypothetical protein
MNPFEPSQLAEKVVRAVGRGFVPRIAVDRGFIPGLSEAEGTCIFGA